MATKNIVPRASGEGGLGREDKPWGSLYAEYIPCVDRIVYYHNSDRDHHQNGIAGNAATASKLKKQVTINRVPFDGSRDIEVSFTSTPTISYTTQEITNLFNSIMNE